MVGSSVWGKEEKKKSSFNMPEKWRKMIFQGLDPNGQNPSPPAWDLAGEGVAEAQMQLG